MKRLLLLPIFGAILCLFVANGPAQDKKGDDKKPDDKKAGDKKADDKKMEDFIVKPGPEHKILETLVGTYDCKVKSWSPAGGEPTLSTGTVVREIIMDGRFLHEKVVGKMDKFEYQARGVMGYDVNAKKYVQAYIDNMSTGISTSNGKYDEGDKTFTFTGKVNMGKSGGKWKTRDVLKIVSDTEQKMEFFKSEDKGKDVETKEMKLMEITFTKKK